MDKNNDGWVAREVMNSIQIQSRLVLNKNKLNYKTDIITSIVQSVSPRNVNTKENKKKLKALYLYKTPSGFQ